MRCASNRGCIHQLCILGWMYSSTLHPSGGSYESFHQHCLFVLVLFKLVAIYSDVASSMAALKQPTIKVVAIIAEGVPESDTKQLIAYARANNKVAFMVSFS